MLFVMKDRPLSHHVVSDEQVGDDLVSDKGGKETQEEGLVVKE